MAPTNGKFRDECLSPEWFRNRTDATVVIERWRGHYNEDRPHSSLRYSGRGYRGTLNKYFGLPRFHQLTRSEAEALLGKLRVDIYEGRYAPKAMAASPMERCPSTRDSPSRTSASSS